MSFFVVTARLKRISLTYTPLCEQNVTFSRLVARAWHVNRATGICWFIQLSLVAYLKQITVDVTPLCRSI